MKLEAIQQALVDRRLDGWLFYDFRGLDPVGSAILGLDRDRFATRRWFYFIPAKGTPTKIVHAIEPAQLDALPGSKKVYLPWQQIREHLAAVLKGQAKIAMQYSPLNNIPYVSRVDAGTVELVRSLQVEVVSSAEMVQEFDAVIDDSGYASHQQAGLIIGDLVQGAFARIGEELAGGGRPTEYGIQQFLVEGFARNGLVADHAPIVAVGPHSADPHYSPSGAIDTEIRAGDFVLIDLWAKQSHAAAIYADITWTAFVGDDPPEEIEKVFDVVRGARDAALRYVQEGLASGSIVRGCDVDDACRMVIDFDGYGDQFVHRTGHSIHTVGHGNGTNLDNLETHDDRPVLPRTCFSIEPGVYLPGRFGIRSEINVFIEDAATAVVTGVAPQQELVRIPAR